MVKQAYHVETCVTSVANIFGSSGFSVETVYKTVKCVWCLVFGDGCESATQLPSLPPFHAEVPSDENEMCL